MAIYKGSTEITNPYFPNVSEMYVGSTQIWPTGLPAGTTYDFKYTGKVQSIELPKGKYRLQCWGAYGGYSNYCPRGGSKGGYSEGVLTLIQPTVLYIFVGGSGSTYQDFTGYANGGWNGGGAAETFSTYSYNGVTGESYTTSGGGATDIATVTSDMSYYNGRTNRSSTSLLSRIIVAGGGAGTSMVYKEVDGEWTEDHSIENQQGGGVSGGGQYAGTQTSGGNGNGGSGGFGYGANQDATNYRYTSGGAGGGWYGGGTGRSDSSMSYCRYAGGGSGFVNTADNASYRPSGYTGLQLDSGITIDGSNYFESVSGGTELGHRGDGYARITVI